MGHVVQDATKTVKNGAHLLVPLQALPEWSLAQSSPRNCTAEYSFQSCIKNSSRLRQRHDTLDMMCVCVCPWRHVTNRPDALLPMAPSATTCARQLACKYCTFHTPKKLLARPVPSQSEVRDRRGLGISLWSRQQSDAKQPTNGQVDQKKIKVGWLSVFLPTSGWLPKHLKKTSAPGMDGICSAPGTAA